MDLGQDIASCRAIPARMVPAKGRMNIPSSMSTWTRSSAMSRYACRPLRLTTKRPTPSQLHSALKSRASLAVTH